MKAKPDTHANRLVSMLLQVKKMEELDMVLVIALEQMISQEEKEVIHPPRDNYSRLYVIASQATTEL
jgi:hypothetical protein